MGMKHLSLCLSWEITFHPGTEHPPVHPAWPRKDSSWVSPCASGVLHWIQGLMTSRAVVYLLSLSTLCEQSPLPLAPKSFRLF